MDTKQVPRGAVASVTYYSTALKRCRRMHIYTPPGYELGKGKFPVFYLLHGAGDCDDSRTSVGRAGFILDNLIAAEKAKPMIIVMPAGHHQRRGLWRQGSGAATATSGQPAPPDWESIHKADLDNPALKKGTKLIWLSTGAHTWINWRNYLNKFAPRLF